MAPNLVQPSPLDALVVRGRLAAAAMAVEEDWVEQVRQIVLVAHRPGELEPSPALGRPSDIDKEAVAVKAGRTWRSDRIDPRAGEHVPDEAFYHPLEGAAQALLDLSTGAVRGAAVLVP